MTEVEKLRALLAEARVALQGVAAYDASPDVSWTLTKEFCRDAIDRIDAALAEPVSNDFKRGAEAMREAVVKFVRKTGWDMNPQVACTIGVLPIPEDK